MASGNLSHIKQEMSPALWISLVCMCVCCLESQNLKKVSVSKLTSALLPQSEEQSSPTTITAALQPWQICLVCPTPDLPRALQRKAGKWGSICLVDTVYPLIDNKVTFRVSLEILFCTVLSRMTKERQVKQEKTLCSLNSVLLAASVVYSVW